MAKDAIGFSIVIDDKLIKTLRKADELIEGLSNTTERTRGKVIKAFRQMGDVGVESFIRKLREAQQAINDLGNKRLGANLFSGFSTGANVGVAEITKLINAVGKLSQASKTNITVNGIDTTSRQAKHAIDAINKLIATLNVLQQKGGQQFLGGVNNIGRQTLREMNNEARKMERTFDRLEQAIQRYGMSASDLANKLQQARDAQRRFNDIAKQQAIGDVQGLVGMKGQAKTLNELRSYAANLKSTMNNLDPKSKDWQQLNVILKQTNSNIKNIENSMKEVKTQSKSLIDTASQLQRSLALLFSVSAIKGYVNKLISVRGEFELQQRALSAILQSKDQADKLWNQTVELAIKSPFTVKELVGYTKQLAAYRIETEKLHDTTKRLADVSAGLGVDMQRLILAFGQVRAASYLRGTELRQFTEAGIPMLEELASYFTELEGRAVSVGDVFGRISKRLVAFSDVEEVFKRMTSAGGVFYEMQEKQAESLKGMMSNLKDRIDLMLNDIGSANDGVLKDMVGLAQSFVANWKEVWFRLKQVILLIVALKAKSLIFRFLATETGLAAKAAFTATTAYTSWGDAFTKFKVAMLGLIPNFSKLKASISGIGASVSSANLSFKRLGSFLSGGLLKGLNLVRAGFNALKVTMSSFLPFLAITAILELYNILTEASRAAKELQEELNRIDVSLGNELSESIATYKELATTMRDLTKSYAEREEAMKAMKRAFGEILPDQMLELEYIRGLDNAYTDATDALKEYYNNKAREQKVAKIDESFEDELNTDIQDYYNRIATSLVKYGEGDSKKGMLMKVFGMDERHVKSVIRKVVDEIKKGTIAVSEFESEFIKRLEKMFNVTIDPSKVIWGTWYEEDLGDITETLQRYKDSVEAVTGLEFETIEQEKQSKEFQRVNKLYEERKAKVDELRIAYSKYYTQLKANKAKGELVTNADKEKLMEYRMDINELYQQLNLPMRPWEKFSKITNSLFDIEKEIEIVSGTINNRFIKAIEKAASQNVKLDKLAEKLKNINDSFTGTDLQQTTEEAFRLAAEMYEIPLNSFDKLKVDGKKSVEDFVKNVESEFQRLEKVITEFDHAMTAAAKLDEKTVEERTSFVEKSLGYTTEEIELFKQQVPALKFIFELFGGIFKNIGNKGNSIWEQRISLLKELRREYVDLSKTFNETTSRQKVMNGYMEAANELFKDLGIEINQIPFDDLERMSAFVSELMKQVKEGSKDEIKLGKLKGFFDVDIETKDTKDYQEQLIKQMQDLFDNYELGKELEKLHLPKELMKQLFDVDVLNLDELRDKITSMDISAFGEDALKEYDKLLDKIREMELKEQEERMKMYSKYLIKAQNERVKAKIDEMKQIEEINKTFVMADDAIINMGIDANQLENIRKSLASQNLTLEQAIENWVIYRDTLQTLGVTDVQIQKLYEYLLALREAGKLAISGVQKETQEKLDKEAWESFKASTMYEQLFSDIENLGNKSIEMLITKLGDLKNNLKKLPPNIYKEIQGQITKLEEIQMKRNPFEKYLESLEKVRDLNKQGVTLTDIDASGVTTERKVGGTEDELTEALVSEQAKIESLKEQQVLYSQLKQAQGDENKLKAAGITLTEGQRKLLGKTQGEYDQLILGAKKQEEQARKNAESLGMSLETYKKMRAANEKAIAHAKAWGEALTGVLDGIDAILDAFGLAEDSTARLWIKNAKQIADMVVQVVILTISLEAMGVAANMALGVIGWIATALQAVALLFSSIFAAHDNALEKQIQELQDNVELLEKSFDKLKKAIDRAYSSTALDDHLDDALVNTQKQIQSYYEMIELEEAKKDRDSEKIEEYRDKIDELREAYQDLKEEVVESLGGSYDIRGTTREFVDAWLEAFRETGSGLDGLKDNFKEFFQNVLLEQAVMKGGATIMEGLLTEINNSLADDSKIDSAEYDVIKQKGEITMEQLNEFLNGLLGEGGLFNEFMTDAGDNLSGLQKGIQGISESTAQVIESYLNSVRFYVADSNSKLGELIKMQTSEEAPNPILSELRVQTELVRGISTLLNSLTAPHPTQAGRGLKVII